jgi:serine/threonine protein kinase
MHLFLFYLDLKSSIEAIILMIFCHHFRFFCQCPIAAPEVLEGKNGHSFEVDVWSTGVIMYTLLVGKPPFESKNVEATYKRIQANSYTFPDQPATCDHAKSLLRDIFQVLPDAIRDLLH